MKHSILRLRLPGHTNSSVPFTPVWKANLTFSSDRGMSSMRYVIGVDLGGTQVRAIRCDPQGNIVAHARTDTAATAGPTGVVQQIEQHHRGGPRRHT